MITIHHSQGGANGSNIKLKKDGKYLGLVIYITHSEDEYILTEMIDCYNQSKPKEVTEKYD